MILNDRLYDVLKWCDTWDLVRYGAGLMPMRWQRRQRLCVHFWARCLASPRRSTISWNLLIMNDS